MSKEPDCPVCGLPHPSTNPYCFCKNTWPEEFKPRKVTGSDHSEEGSVYVQGEVREGVLHIERELRVTPKNQ